MVGTPRHAFGFREAALGSLTQVLKKQSRGNCDGRDRSICGIREPVAALSVLNDTERRAPFVGSQRQQTFLAQLPALCRESLGNRTRASSQDQAACSSRQRRRKPL